jgi:hypothetical protein
MLTTLTTLTQHLEPMRDKMPTIPEDLSEYARIHTGRGSWSETQFECAAEACEPATPQAPYVTLADLTTDT